MNMNTATAKRDSASSARVATEVITASTSRDCHNHYRSVAVELMQPEIIRAVRERFNSSSESTHSNTHKLLLKALWRYTGVPTENIAIAPDVATIMAGLICNAQRDFDAITCVGPISQDTLRLTRTPIKVIPSLVDSSNEEISDALSESTQVLYLASPNVTSGEVYTVTQIRRILNGAGSALVIVDESLFEYCNATCAKLLEEFSNLIILRTFAEAFGLGNSQVAYALGDKERIQSLNNHIQPELTECDDLIAATIALGRQDVMHRIVNTICENRIYLTALLRRLGAEIILSPADFVLLKISNPEMALEILSPQGVTFCEFEYKGESQGFLRIPVGNDRYCRAIVAALTRCPREYYQTTIASRNKSKTDYTHKHKAHHNNTQYQYITNTEEIQR